MGRFQRHRKASAREPGGNPMASCVFRVFGRKKWVIVSKSLQRSAKGGARKAA